MLTIWQLHFLLLLDPCFLAFYITCLQAFDRWDRCNEKGPEMTVENRGNQSANIGRHATHCNELGLAIIQARHKLQY